MDPVRGKIRTIHADLRRAIRGLGRVKVGAIKTLVYFSDRTHFCTVHLHKDHLRVELLSARPIRHARVERTVRLGRGRHVNVVRLTARDRIDRALAGWLREAYELSGR
jgi:hypothetical protein